MKFNIYVGCLALFCVSGVANAGLFDDLTKMQNSLQDLQQGGGLKAPSVGGSGLGGLSIPAGAAAGGQAAGAGMGNCGGPDKKKLACVCRSTFMEGAQVNKKAVIDKLPPVNVGLLASDIAADLGSLNNEFKRPLDKTTSSEDVSDLSWYKNAFETGEFAVVFNEFLKATAKTELLSQIKQVADGKTGFDTKKKAFKRDAQQAYGIILMYYQKFGAKADVGLKYLKDAAKGDPSKAFIATYQLGHRAFKGIGESRNLNKAATWMLKSFQAVQERDRKAGAGQTVLHLSPAFSSLVQEEFTSLVSDPAYSRRDQYASLMQQAEQMRAGVQNSIQDAKGKAPEFANIERAYLLRLGEVHVGLLKSSNNAAKATALEGRILKFEQDRDWSDEDSNDLRISMPGTDEIIKEVIAGMGTMNAEQTEAFQGSMKELAALVTDMAKIQTSMIQRVTSGEVPMTILAAYPRVSNSVPRNCAALDSLNGELEKAGKPGADINDIGQDSDGITLAIP